MYKYLGPSDVFIYNNTPYHQGDSIPLTKDEMEHHVGAGHRFEGMKDEPSVPTMELAGNVPMPKDDAGKDLQVKK